MSVRVRYAPSPTGLQHIGGLRTALFNYLFARAKGGQFFLRIEDTDQSRYDPDAEKDLYDTLRWAGIEWDEGPDKGGPYGPYVQSKRLDLYQKYARQLIESGHAYECFCTPERMDNLRKTQEAQKLPSGYDKRCRALTNGEAEEARSSGIRPVVRFKMPDDGVTTVRDQILGEVSKTNSDLPPDPIILKSDGFPTYHLAHVVDDHLMQTTHVLRAQEWLPSSFLHVLMFGALGWDVPQYCHLPLILGQDGQKLSKRHGATSVRQFKDDGYLPEAVVNYLALLGWSYDDSREFFTKAELEQVFDLNRLNKSPAVFDYKKLEHFNASYIRQMSDETLKRALEPGLRQAGFLQTPSTTDQDRMLTQLVPLIRERLKYVREAPEMTRFVWSDVTSWPLEDLVPKKLDTEKTAEILNAVLELLDGYEERTDEDNEALFRSKGEELGVKLGDFMQPVRVAVSGSKVSPPMFGTMRVLGSETVKRRIAGALKALLG